MGSPAPKTPLMLLDTEHFLRDTGSLSDCNYIAYTSAMIHQWVHGSLPSDLDECARIMRLHTVDRIATAVSLLRRFFRQRTDGTWAHLGTQEKRTASKAKSKSYSERGMKGNAKRWAGHVAKRPTKNPAYVGRYATASATPVVKGLSSTSTPLPSQAQGVPPTQLGPRRVPDRKASHTPPKRQAAKRQRPVERPAAPQTSLPLSEVPAAQSARQSAPASTATVRRCNSQNTPLDPRFDEIANELRTNFWPGVASGECPWHNKAKAALSRFLAGAGPEMSLGDVRVMLTHRADSIMARKITGSQPIEQWIERLHMWRNGPCDDFGKPVDTRRRM